MTCNRPQKLRVALFALGSIIRASPESRKDIVNNATQRRHVLATLGAKVICVSDAHTLGMILYAMAALLVVSVETFEEATACIITHYSDRIQNLKDHRSKMAQQMKAAEADAQQAGAELESTTASLRNYDTFADEGDEAIKTAMEKLKQGRRVRKRREARVGLLKRQWQEENFHDHRHGGSLDFAMLRLTCQ